jgi:hypothetical protein
MNATLLLKGERERPLLTASTTGALSVKQTQGSLKAAPLVLLTQQTAA